MTLTEPNISHVYEKSPGSEQDVDIFVLEPPRELAKEDSEGKVLRIADAPGRKANSVSALISSLYYVTEDCPLDRLVEELSGVKSLFSLGVVNSRGEAKGLIIRRELFDLVGRSGNTDHLKGKRAGQVMKLVKTFSPRASVFSVGSVLEEEMQDKLIGYFMIKDEYARFAGSFSTKDMMLFYSRTMGREMQLVQEIQSRIVEPESRLILEDGSSLRGINRHAREAGGDYYLIRRLPDGRVFYALADVSGKGYAASLLTAIIGSFLESTSFSKGLSASLNKLNGFLQKKFSDKGLFVTGVFILFSEESPVLEVCSCAHPFFYVLRDRKLRKLKCISNPPLGLEGVSSLESFHIRPEGGDLLVLVSDGIPEQMNELGDNYPLVALSSLSAQADKDDFRAAVLSEIDSFRGFAPQHDDITLLVHKIGGH